MSMKIILASGSPRRSEILTTLNLPFQVILPEVDEGAFQADTPEELVQLLARKKVEDVAARLEEPAWILGCDTLVIQDEHILGKPENREEAKKMLEKISGKVHKVMSGIALLPQKGYTIGTKVAVTEVKVKDLAADEVDYYLATGEWQGAAGGYRIQERGALFIEWIKGSYSNVVGLPISLFYGMLRENHFIFN